MESKSQELPTPKSSYHKPQQRARTPPNPPADKSGHPPQTEPVKETEYTTVQRKKQTNKANKAQPAVKANRYSILASIPDPEEEEEISEMVMNTPLDKQRIGKEVDNLDCAEPEHSLNQGTDKTSKNFNAIQHEMDISKELKRNRAQLGSTPLSASKGGTNKPPNKR